MEYEFEPIQWVVRAYSPGCTYHDHQPFSGVFNIVRVDRHTGYAFAAHGAVDEGLRKPLRKFCKEQGIKTLLFERDDGMHSVEMNKKECTCPS